VSLKSRLDRLEKLLPPPTREAVLHVWEKIIAPGSNPPESISRLPSNWKTTRIVSHREAPATATPAPAALEIP
jgi:hypothetical protein